VIGDCLLDQISVYRLLTTEISILDLENDHLMVAFNPDFIDNIRSDYKTEFQNPLPLSLIERVIYETHNEMRKAHEPRKALLQLKQFVSDLNLNVEQLMWKWQDGLYQQQIRLPTEWSNPEAVGDIVWALKSFPSQVAQRGQQWIRTLIDRSVKKSLEITDKLSLSNVRCDDPFIIFLSRERAQEMWKIMKQCFLYPSLDQVGNLCRLRFYLTSDKKRIGRSDRCNVTDSTFVYSFLELIFRKHPRGIFMISDLSNLLGIRTNELFVYLQRMAFLIEFYSEDAIQVKSNPRLDFDEEPKGRVRMAWKPSFKYGQLEGE